MQTKCKRNYALAVRGKRYLWSVNSNSQRAMTKTLKTILTLCLMLPMATWAYANDVTRTEKDGAPIIIIKGASHISDERGSTIHASINGHTLVVTFSENLGQVQVEVTTAAGATVQCVGIQTPNGLQCHIPNAGDYIVIFTLPNGDEYYGEFTVTD